MLGLFRGRAGLSPEHSADSFPHAVTIVLALGQR